MLARSVITRSFATLVTSPLDFGQSAPIGWLYIVKLFGACGGYSEQSMRLLSYLSYLGCIAMIIVWCHGKVKSWPYALSFACFFAVSPFYLRYANECKPYMSDNFWVICSLYTYCLHRRGRVRAVLMSAQFITACLMSFPAVFAVVSCLIWECSMLLRERLCSSYRPQMIMNLGILCIPVVGMLFFLYILWISPLSKNVGDPGYWKLLSFPVHSYRMMCRNFVEPFSGASLLPYTLLILASFVHLLLHIGKKNFISDKTVLPLCTVLFVLFASFCGYYPIQDRLIQFIPLLLLIYASQELGPMWERIRFHSCAKIYGAFFSVCIVSVVMLCSFQVEAIRRLIRASHDEEKMSFVNIYSSASKNTDMVFVNKTGVPLFEYLTGCFLDCRNLDWISYQKGKVFYASRLHRFYFCVPYSYEAAVDEGAYKESVNKLKEQSKALLFFSHDSDEIIFEELRKYGKIEPIYNRQQIRMYTYSRNSSEKGA